MSLFEEVISRGIPYEHHESDLYIPFTKETEKLVRNYNVSAERFISQIDGKVWFDIPFVYEPYWEKKQRLVRKNPSKKVCKKKMGTVMHEFKTGKLRSGKGKKHKVKSRTQAIRIGLETLRDIGCGVKPYDNPVIADHFSRLYTLGEGIAFEILENIVEPTIEEARNFYYKAVGKLIGNGEITSELEQEMILEGFLHALSREV